MKKYVIKDEVVSELQFTGNRFRDLYGPSPYIVPGTVDGDILIVEDPGRPPWTFDPHEYSEYQEPQTKKYIVKDAVIDNLTITKDRFVTLYGESPYIVPGTVNGDILIVEDPGKDPWKFGPNKYSEYQESSKKRYRVTGGVGCPVLINYYGSVPFIVEGEINEYGNLLLKDPHRNISWVVHKDNFEEVVDNNKNEDKGVKYDSGKLLPSLFQISCSKAIQGVVSVLTYRATKYKPNGWQAVDESRYWDALYRHLSALHGGEVCDPESGLPHIDHVATNIMFISQKRKDDGEVGEDLQEVLERAQAAKDAQSK